MLAHVNVDLEGIPRSFSSEAIFDIFILLLPSDVIQLGRGKVNTIIEHDDINLWDIGMRRLCCWRLFCGDLYRLGFCVTAVGRPTAEYPGYFGFSLGFNKGVFVILPYEVMIVPDYVTITELRQGTLLIETNLERTRTSIMPGAELQLLTSR